MLTDKTLSTDDYDNEHEHTGAMTVAMGSLICPDTAARIAAEPNHKTQRRARRASARLQFDKDMLKYTADKDAYLALPQAQREKAKVPVKPKDWRAPKPPMPVANLWFSRVKQKGGIITARLGKLNATLPAIPEVKILLNARDGTLIQVPVSILTRQFGGRVWR